jgi:MinD-like ATPase involved in chromosome partitioning or flagellar assembly/CheY-like chemotaxis protein
MTEKTVLIVDGDTASRNFLARIFNQKQCHVLETSLGREGLVFAWRDRPDLILVDPNITDLSGEELLRKLRADARTASVPAIALSSDPNPLRKKACREAGFNEYFYKSEEEVPLLMDAIDLWLREPAEPPSEEPKDENKGGQLIVFLSAKGGTGSSSLCANVAMNIFQHKPKARVVVLDSVLPIGSIAFIVGYDGQMNLSTIAALPPEETNETFFRENLPELPAWRFRLLAGVPDPENTSNLNVNRIGQIVQMLKAAYDYIFIDIGRSLSQIILPLIQQAEVVALVVSADMVSIVLTRVILGYLQEKGLPPNRIYAILNRVVGFEGVSKSEVESLLGLPIQNTVPYLGGNFSLANNQHIPLALKFPGDTTAMILKEMASQIIGLADRVRAESQ